MKILRLVLLTLMFPLVVVIGQPRSDRLQDGLLGPVRGVIETYTQSECKDPSPVNHTGSIRLISYDREGNKTAESYDPNYSFSAALTYSRATDGTVLMYDTVNRFGNMPVQILVYRIVREYDSTGNMLKEVAYRGVTMVYQIKFTSDTKGRVVNSKTLQAAQSYSFDQRFTAAEPSTFKPFSSEAIYKYGAGVFPEKATFLSDGKATSFYSYQYKYDGRGNWVKRTEVWKSRTSDVDSNKTVTCRKLDYY
jgi:hypothetical protein